MVRSLETGDLLLKIKSTHYLTKKFLMRMGANKVEYMFENTKLFKESLDEEFQSIVDFITQGWSKEVWVGYTDQQRRIRIEDYFNEEDALLDQGFTGIGEIYPS